MLLIDRVVEMVPGKSIVAIKNVSINEPFFNGHFPHHPVMPGVLIVEAMAQASALFSFTDENGGLKCEGAKTAYYLVGIDGAAFPPSRGAGRPVAHRSRSRTPEPQHL